MGKHSLSLKKRRAIFDYYHGQCFFCGAQTTIKPMKKGQQVEPYRFSIDHLIPKNQGGDNSVQNLVCSCHACNLLKGTLPWDKFFSVRVAYLDIWLPGEFTPAKRFFRSKIRPLLDQSRRADPKRLEIYHRVMAETPRVREALDKRQQALADILVEKNAERMAYEREQMNKLTQLFRLLAAKYKKRLLRGN